jgi:hypothetical protein
MKPLVPAFLLALVILAIPAQLSAQNASLRPRDDAVVVLITEKEAALGSKEKNPIALASNADAEDRAITRNPKIFLASPSGAATSSSPIHFEIKFLAFNGAQIDPKQVKITYLKGSPIDLTARVAVFIRGDGIDIPRARVAAGKHVIKVDVTDTEGRAASTLLTVDVAP